jgi:ferredoxin-nitrate reductase
MHPKPFIEIHPRDARSLSIQNDDMVEVRSARGKAQFPALITEFISPGTVFVPMHWGELWADRAEANAMTHNHCCPDSKQPELKACAVSLCKLAAPFPAMAVVNNSVSTEADRVPILAISV